MNKKADFYRADIDGLRAVSVLAILFFHAGFEWAAGGFVGVDVFFVISGFLITRNICKQLEKDNFSFAFFYVRRINRLIPALIFTLILVFLFAYLLFSPSDLERLGGSLQYAIVSLSNFFFWNEAGYFNSASELKPLLHTWSLAVEEQFYLFWPLLIFLTSLIKIKHGISYLLILLFVSSLALNLIFIQNHPSSAFFMLPFRVFEFALGGLCFSVLRHNNLKQSYNEMVSILGLGLIVYSILFFDKQTIFPGLNGLLPSLGAAFLIVSKPSFISKYILSIKIVVLLGLISYSVYLIHWPLFVYYKYWKFADITVYESSLIIIVSLVFGYLMWRFIEQPFRKYSLKKNTIKVFSVFVIVIGVFSSIAIYTKSTKGYPNRFPQQFFMTSDEILENRDRYWQYFNQERQQQKINPNDKNVVVMGNSHAVDLIFALTENDAKLNITFYNSWHTCFNFGTPLSVHDKKACESRLNRHLKTKAWKDADAIYLHDNWPRLDLKDLRKRIETLRKLTKAPIYIFGPKMTYTKRVPDIVLSHMRMSSINQYAAKYSETSDRQQINKMLNQWIEKLDINNVFYIDILSIQCGNMFSNCEVVSKQNSKFLYFDFSHFTLQGAKEFGAKLKAQHAYVFE